MDIISLGKAKKAIKEMQKYHEQILGMEVESYFPSVDARIDYLESQLSQDNVVREYDFKEALSKLEGFEMSGGNVKLKHLGKDEDDKDLFLISTEGELLVDLGASFISAKELTFKTGVAVGQVVEIQVAESNEQGQSPEYQSLPASFVPTKRFLKFKVKMETSNTFHSKQTSSIELEGHENMKDELLLKKEIHDMSLDLSWTEEGSLHRKLLPKNEWARIDKLNI